MQRDRKRLVWALAALLMVGSLAGGLVIAQSGRTAPANSPATTASNINAPALGPMVPVTAGNHVEARLTTTDGRPLGTVTTTFTAPSTGETS